MMAHKCIGFGKYEGRCTNEICPESPYWCKRCEELRRDYITKRLNDLAGYIQEKTHGSREDGE
jgi:hypothetical protein